MAKKGILITGGAGYIGSHVVKQLGARAENVVILDNLSTGFEDAVLYGQLYIGDCGDADKVSEILRQHDIDTVIHFAAHTIVPESVSDPMKYYGNNTCQTRSLLQSCQRAGVKHFIFSSTAAVYGVPDSETVNESTPTQPINPYGSSKLMSEWMLRDLAKASDMRYVALRYFNVAGSDPEAKIGQSTRKATLLIKVACEAAIGKRDSVSVFGSDYATRDGTGIRDYIHVEDLASAHLSALQYLRDGGDSTTLNCGYGHGYSVREVLDSVQRVSGTRLTIHDMPRRAGDPPCLIAEVKKIHQLLDWKTEFDDLDKIVATSLAWEKVLQEREK